MESLASVLLCVLHIFSLLIAERVPIPTVPGIDRGLLTLAAALVVKAALHYAALVVVVAVHNAAFIAVAVVVMTVIHAAVFQ